MNSTDQKIKFSARDLLRELRVNQWTKNAIVMAAFSYSQTRGYYRFMKAASNQTSATGPSAI